MKRGRKGKNTPHSEESDYSPSSDEDSSNSDVDDSLRRSKRYRAVNPGAKSSRSIATTWKSSKWSAKKESKNRRSQDSGVGINDMSFSSTESDKVKPISKSERLTRAQRRARGASIYKKLKISDDSSFEEPISASDDEESDIDSFNESLSSTDIKPKKYPTRSTRIARSVSKRKVRVELSSSDEEFLTDPIKERQISSRRTKSKINLKEPTNDSILSKIPMISTTNSLKNNSKEFTANEFQTFPANRRNKCYVDRSIHATKNKNSGDLFEKSGRNGLSEDTSQKEQRTKKIPTKTFNSTSESHSSESSHIKTKKYEERETDSDFYLTDQDESSEKDRVDKEEFKIERIIASKSYTIEQWNERCQKMNSSEIKNGSRWEQDEDKMSGNEDEETKFEERFLIKWRDLSYLHCSWETRDDLTDLIEAFSTCLKQFTRKNEDGYFFDADDRGDGEFFDPQYVQIERILEIQNPEYEDDSGKSKGNALCEDNNWGLIFEEEHPDYENGTGRQFLVKWGNTPYSDCTYEFERDLISNSVEYEDQLKSFLKRKNKPTQSQMNFFFAKQEKQTRHFYKIFGDKIKDGKEKEARVEQYKKKLEEYIFANGGQLRDYQAEGVSWLLANNINNRSSILADEMGLGKTIQTAAYVEVMVRSFAVRGPFLIVAPLSTVHHWYREFTGWTELNTIIYHGSAKEREMIREMEFAFESDRPESGKRKISLKYCHSKTAPRWMRTWMVQVVITTPEMLVTDDFLELAAVRWELLVVDEAHRLKNHSSKLANNLRNKRFRFKRTLLLTGTPIQNNMNELWTLMNMADPKEFSDVDKFMERYGNLDSKESVDELHSEIRPYILRRLKEDAEKNVPPKEETVIEIELTVLQKQYYRALYEKNLHFLHRNGKKALDGPSLTNLAMQLRKCCNHPFLLKGVEDKLRAESKQKTDETDFLVKASGKLVLLDKLLPRLKDGGHRVLIFSQFKIMLDVIEDYLHLRGHKSERIDGSITGKKRQMAIDRFQSEGTMDSSFIMLLSTRAGGVGINLTAADTCIIFDSDWNPQNDIQAQSRCHRIGQSKNVKVYRLLSRKTYEMQMFHKSSLKMGLDQAVLNGIENNSKINDKRLMTKEEIERLLRHGAYDLFREEKAGVSEKESNDFLEQDIDSILERRTKKIVHENTGSQSIVAGGTFSKASFKAIKNKSDSTKQDAVSDIDIDDPEFWKKTVGEVQGEETELLPFKDKKRKKVNYNEDKYYRSFLDSDDDKEIKPIFSFRKREDDASVSSAEVASIASDDSDNDAEPVVSQNEHFPQAKPSEVSPTFNAVPNETQLPTTTESIKGKIAQKEVIEEGKSEQIMYREIKTFRNFSKDKSMEVMSSFPGSRVVDAPPGLLGLILADSPNGVYVVHVSEGSYLCRKIFRGDIILHVIAVNRGGMNVEYSLRNVNVDLCSKILHDLKFDRKHLIVTREEYFDPYGRYISDSSSTPAARRAAVMESKLHKQQTKNYSDFLNVDNEFSSEMIHSKNQPLEINTGEMRSLLQKNATGIGPDFSSSSRRTLQKTQEKKPIPAQLLEKPMISTTEPRSQVIEKIAIEEKICKHTQRNGNFINGFMRQSEVATTQGPIVRADKSMPSFESPITMLANKKTLSEFSTGSEVNTTKNTGYLAGKLVFDQELSSYENKAATKDVYLELEFKLCNSTGKSK